MRTSARSRVATSTALVVVIASTALAACGGNEPTLSRAAFTKKANAECATLLAAGDALFSETSASATGPAVTEVLGTAADQLRDLARAFDEFVPPDTFADDVDRLVALVEQYADGLDDLAAQVEPGQSLAGVQSANPSIVRPLNTISERIDTLIRKLGLTGCVAL